MQGLAVVSISTCFRGLENLTDVQQAAVLTIKSIIEMPWLPIKTHHTLPIPGIHSPDGLSERL